MKILRSVLFILVLQLTGIQAGAQISCGNSHLEPSQTALILSRMQDPRQGLSHLLVEQGTFDRYIKPTGGGACATVTAVHLIQVLRLMAKNLGQLKTDRIIHDSFAALPELRDGRVTDHQMHSLLLYLKRYLPNSDYTVDLQKPPYQKAQNLLVAQVNEVKLLIYKVTSPQGKTLGRHFVLLYENLNSGKLSVHDPNRPLKIFSYFAEGTSSGIFLNRDAQANPKLNTNQLDSVFTVRLLPTSQ